MSHRISTGGFGVLSDKNVSVFTLQSPSVSVEFGKYHNLYNGSPPYISPQVSTFEWNDYPMGDGYNPDDGATAIAEPVSQSRSEVAAVNIVFKNLYEGGTVNFSWYRQSDNKLLANNSEIIEDPGLGQIWLWHWVYAWIGKFPHEIDRVGTYYVVISSPWYNTTIYFNVVCTPSWRCEQPLNGYEEDRCGNRRQNIICQPTNLVNGTFNSNLNGWSILSVKDSDVIWDNGRARLRANSCSSIYLYQYYTITKQFLKFNWEAAFDFYFANTRWELSVDGIAVIRENLILGFGSPRSGTTIKDISSYIGKVAKLSFMIETDFCYYDATNVYLWIDNVEEFSCNMPLCTFTLW